jgi:hypothetical protein
VNSGTTRTDTPTPSLAKLRRNITPDRPLGQETRRAGPPRPNRRLYDAVDQWAFCALSSSPGARAFYDQQRAAEESHHQALRALGNRLVGILHGCLRHRTLYNEDTAWAHRQITQAA